MKTTIELSDPLLRDAKRLALSRQTTLRALIEDGLRRVIAMPDGDRQYMVADTVVTGRRPSRWDELSDHERRELIYGSEA